MKGFEAVDHFRERSIPGELRLVRLEGEASENIEWFRLVFVHAVLPTTTTLNEVLASGAVFDKVEKTGHEIEVEDGIV